MVEKAHADYFLWACIIFSMHCGYTYVKVSEILNLKGRIQHIKLLVKDLLYQYFDEFWCNSKKIPQALIRNT